MKATTKVLAVLGLAGPLLASASVASAAPPTRFSTTITFVDVNPCTGLDHTVTIAADVTEIYQGGRTVGHAKRTTSTEPTGFVGRGTDSFVDNGQVVRATQTDILTNPAGDRIRASSVFVVDKDTGVLRVEKFELTCLGPS